MKSEDLEIKKFELEQKVKLEELELKKKELDLRIQELKGKRISTPLILSIVGGLVTIITGIVLNYFDNKSTIALEDRKFQSSLLLKATDAKTYDEFSNMLIALQENGLLSLDSAKVANFRKQRFITEQTEELIKSDSVSNVYRISDEPRAGGNFVWTIVAGGDANLDGAKYEKSKAERNGFEDVGIWYRSNSYRTCIGKFPSNTNALNSLFDVKEKINGTSYVVRLDKWCPDFTYDAERGIYICN